MFDDSVDANSLKGFIRAHTAYAIDVEAKYKINSEHMNLDLDLTDIEQKQITDTSIIEEKFDNFAD